MKEQLQAIFDILKMVETRGESTLMVADCVRELYKIISELPNENEVNNEQVSNIK